MAAALAAFAMVAVSCGKNETPEPVEEQLEVNANNISGQWKLVDWNGSNLTEGTYVYLDIVRNDKTYTMYQNLDSFNNIPHVITGSYNLAADPELGAIIRGSYDHDNGDWSHRYIIKDLYENEMLWVAKDDPAFTQKFCRVSTIPVE